MFLMHLEDYEERLHPEMLLSLLPSLCSSHSLQLSSWNLLWTPLKTKISSHRDLTEIRQCLRKIQPSIAGHMWVANSWLSMGDEFFLLAWSGKLRSSFVAYLSGSTSTLLPRYAQVGWECTVPKSAGFPHIMLKWQVLRWRAMQVCQCAPLCSIILGCTGDFV